MTAIDTNMNAPESLLTLLIQQSQLLSGKRFVQMFPTGTFELPIPNGMSRVENNRGVFHYNPGHINDRSILSLSAEGRENEFLELGPYSKSDISDRAKSGENVTIISEYTKDGVEVRAALAADSTIDAQLSFFERTKTIGNSIIVGHAPDRIVGK